MDGGRLLKFGCQQEAGMMLSDKMLAATMLGGGKFQRVSTEVFFKSSWT